MSCQRCGRRSKGRLCRDCERLEKFGNIGADQSQPDRGELLHECTNCGTEYETDGSDACPNCGSSRRRYIGDQEETEQADGGREVCCPTHPDARVKARTRTDMVGCPVTIYRCIECGDELTPRADSSAERAMTDGGVDQPAAGTERETVGCESCGTKMWDDEHGREEMAIHEAECDWPDDPRERFDAGDDVQYSDLGRKRLDRSHREGTVIGFSTEPYLVRVKWNGRKTPQRLAHSFVKRVDSSNDTDTAERAMTDGGVGVDESRQAFLGGDAHWCDLCNRAFDSLKELVNHTCGASPDGGVEMITREGPHATTVSGPEPPAFKEWEQQHEDGGAR